jgi:superoxide reductase
LVLSSWRSKIQKIIFLYQDIFHSYIGGSDFILEIYECGKGGKLFLLIQEGEGACNDQSMMKIVEKTDDVGKEKHVPVIEKTPKGIKVKVGAVPHPMEKEHYIKWIEVMGERFLQTGTLQPGEKPEKEFCVDSAQVQKVRICCNIHGFWKNRP